jgi:eukaryotic-like serine/threonine-protein kinase
MDGQKVKTGLPGNTLGKYRLIAELGHGGMAEVFLAVARGPAGFNKLLVIKQIRPQLAEDPDFLSMFLDEARLAARLSHPNVVQTNEVGEENHRYFIAMEYLEGQPLNRILHRMGRNGALPLAMHLRIICEVLGGLQHAHDLTDYDGTPLHVVHRDATPHNIFLTYDGQVKVVDFGIAKAMNSSSETKTGVLKGKVAYMAPEQAKGDRVDRRADVFSVGVILWEALAGRRLWKGLNDIAVLNHIISGDIPSPRTVNPTLHERLEEICMLALAPNRDDRYESASALQMDLEQCIEEIGERGSVREAGRLVGEYFAEERAKMKSIIETQLRNAKSLPTGEYGALEIPQLVDPMRLSQAGPTVDTAGSGSLPGALVSSTPVRVQQPSVTEATPYSSLAGNSNTPPPEAPSRSSRRAAMVTGAVAATAVIVAGVIWVSARGPAHESPVAASSSAPESGAAPAPPTAKPTAGKIDLKVSVSPEGARLFLDDKPLDANPFTGKLPQDGEAHTLRAEAPGYASRVRTITFEKDLEIEFALDKEKADKPVMKFGGPAVPEDDMKPRQPIKRKLDETVPKF